MSERGGWCGRLLLAAVVAGCGMWSVRAQDGAQTSEMERKAAESEQLGQRNREAIDKKAAASPDQATYSIRKVAAVSNLGTTRQYDSLLAADAPMRVKWSLPMGGAKVRRLTVPPEESGMKYLLIETENNDLVAVRRDNGEALWWVQCPAPITGNIYVGNYSVMFICNGRIVRLERMSGDVIWNVELPFAPSAGPCAVEDGVDSIMVFVPGMDRGVYCFDVTNEEWPPKTTGSALHRSDFTVELFYYRQLWTFRASGVVGNSMLFYDTRLFTGCWNDRIYGINIHGALDTGSPQDVWEFRPRAGTESSPVTDKMYIYVASLDSNLYCLNRQSGSLVWRYVAEDRLYDTPSLFLDRENERVYILQKIGKSGPVVCVRREDGLPVWQAPAGDRVVASLKEENADPLLRKVLVVSGTDGTLRGYCLTAPDKRSADEKALAQQQQTVRTGQTSWTIANAPFSGFATNAYDPYVFALTQDGSVVIALEKND